MLAQATNKLRRMINVRALALYLLLVLAAGCINDRTPKGCTMEAKICPDGSAVGRSGLNCEFAPCPNTCVCPEGYRQEGDACNPECYYSKPPCLAPSVKCEYKPVPTT